MENWSIEWIRIPGIISDRKQSFICKAIVYNLKEAISYDCKVDIVKGEEFCYFKSNKLYVELNREKEEREIILLASYKIDEEDSVYETINIIQSASSSETEYPVILKDFSDEWQISLYTDNTLVSKEPIKIKLYGFAYKERELKNEDGSTFIEIIKDKADISIIEGGKYAQLKNSESPFTLALTRNNSRQTRNVIVSATHEDALTKILLISLTALENKINITNIYDSINIEPVNVIGAGRLLNSSRLCRIHFNISGLKTIQYEELNTTEPIYYGQRSKEILKYIKISALTNNDIILNISKPKFEETKNEWYVDILFKPNNESPKKELHYGDFHFYDLIYDYEDNVSRVYFDLYESLYYPERKVLIQIELDLSDSLIPDTIGHLTNTIEISQESDLIQDINNVYTDKSGKEVPIVFASSRDFNIPEWISINDSNRTHSKASYGLIEGVKGCHWYADLHFGENTTKQTRYANIYSTFAYLKSNTYKFIQSN